MFQQHQVLWCLTAALLLLPAPARADGPADNLPDNVRRIPKLGVEVPDADRQELEAGLKTLADLIAQIRAEDPTHYLLPDVEIYHRAVDQALRYQEFFDAKEIPVAKNLLKIGQERAHQLLADQAPWTRATGLVVRGYRSRIDHTVQPYGLVIPDDYDFQGLEKGVPRSRCDLWFHGRGETLSEVNFIQQRQTNKGEFTPPGTIVLHPYGRYCNANKFAGEIDTFEALAAAQKFYRIDPQRIAVRGFSMGGAACWQFAVHYPGKWFAANPGAGFSETPDFLKVFQNETLQPTWYEQKLWRWYDCTGYAANLAFLPTVAYSGDMDKQKQAADIMEVALKGEGLPLRHIIGPMTAHRIHPDSKVEIDQILAEWDRLGPAQTRKSPYPLEDGWETVDQFVTYTLRYHQSRWITLEGLEEHWEQARVVLQRSTLPGKKELRVRTRNVAALTLDPELSPALFDQIVVDDQARFDWGGGKLRLAKLNGKWTLAGGDAGGRRKRPGLQGPIDDAFLDAFLFVKPTGKGISPQIDEWVQAEFQHAVAHWRQQMRGDARVKLDTEVTKADMQDAHIVLWGDPQSNVALASLVADLPIAWKTAEKSLKVGEQAFDGATHVPLLIFPNPLAPHRYVVLNSSFTYREYDYLNNARQTPKLPDWAVVDVRVKPNSRFPGKVVAADFFDEQWRVKPPRP